jgi:signal transduction histidine kinase
MTPSVSDYESALSGTEASRLQAARELRRTPEAQLLAVLQKARAREGVRWIRIALDEAIAAARDVETPAADDHFPVEQDDSDALQAYADGRRDGLRQALHELSPIVGLARVAAEDGDEVGVSRQLDRLRAVCAGLRGFASASAVAQIGEFDLSSVPLGLAENPPIDCPEGLISANGVSPLLVRGNRDLLELALRPVVVNAVEAVRSLGGEPQPNAVMISWGLEQESCWIAVIDRGPGPASEDDPFLPGASTKPDHLGFGLTTAQAAMASLGGEVEMGLNGHGGTSVLLQWGGAL